MGIILQSLGLQALADEPSGATYIDVQPPARSEATDLTTSRALSLPSVYRSVQITSGMASQLPIEAVRAGQIIKTPSLLLTPDPWRSLQSWVERLVIDLMCDGNGFLLKTRGTAGEVVALTVLNPFSVSVRRDAKTGTKSYDYATQGAGTVNYKDDEIVHLWAMEVPGQNRSVSPITACRLSITGALDSRDFGASFLTAGDTPSGVLTTEQALDPIALAEYKKVWQEQQGHSIRVMGRGLKYEPIMLKPEDAQWIEAQKFSILDVCRLFGTPAAYLYAGIDGSSMTYQNLEQVDAQFLRTTLFPVYLSKIASALTGVLPIGESARFNTDALLKPDTKTRAEVDKSNIESGIYDASYVRQRDGIPDSAAPKAKELAA